MCRKITSLFASILFLSSLLSFEGTITNDTTWSGTVNLTGDVVVAGGVLTISPGAVIKAVKKDQADSTDNLAGDGRVGIRVTGSGAIQAVGTQQNIITFTSAEASPAKGDWWGVELMYLTNDSLSLFKYCHLEYGFRAFTASSQEQSWGDTLSWQQPSDLTIDNCVMSFIQKDAIFISCDAHLKVTNCVIYDAEMGIFLRGTKTNEIKNTLVANTSAGINLVADKPNTDTHATDVVIDHLTIYNTDMMATTNPKWWTGYGIYCTVNRGVGTLSLTNSVLVQSTLANIRIDDRGIWTVNHDYNCWYTGLQGLMNIEGGTLAAHEMETDPLFEDAANADFRLQTGSPALGSASDGSNLGAWQSGDLWWKDLVVPPTAIRESAGDDNTVSGNIRIRLNRDQDVIITIPGEQPVELVLYDQAGNEAGTIADRDFAAGEHLLRLPEGLNSGVYFINCLGTAAQLFKIALVK